MNDRKSIRLAQQKIEASTGKAALRGQSHDINLGRNVNGAPGRKA